MGETSGAMMVLAVYVVCDGSAHGHQGRTWCDVRKPASRKRDIDDFAQQDSRLALEDTGIWIEADKSIEAARMQQCAALIETYVAVTASVSVGQHRFRRRTR